jgi:hypothetical protein
MREQLKYEQAMGTGGRSGRTGTAGRPCYGPIGANGYFQPVFDPATGAIDHGVAAYWKEHTDLNAYLQRNWKEIGPEARRQDPHLDRRRGHVLPERRGLPARRLPEDDHLAAVGRIDHVRAARAALLGGAALPRGPV